MVLLACFDSWSQSTPRRCRCGGCHLLAAAQVEARFWEGVGCACGVHARPLEALSAGQGRAVGWRLPSAAVALLDMRAIASTVVQPHCGKGAPERVLYIWREHSRDGDNV
jgi:hypothetical protein